MFGWLRTVKNFFRRIFGIADIHYIDLIDEYEEYLVGQDIKKHNTLIGTVRNVGQYPVNYSSLFYHIPAYYVSDPDAVEFIALYRSKNLFADDCGLKHYGKVISWSLVERCDIKEIPKPYSREKYYRFDVNEWNTLERVVRVRGNGPHVYMMSNKFLVENSYYFNELLISNNEEYKLYRALKDMIIERVYDGFYVGDSRVRISRKKIIVTTPKRKKHIKISDYKNSQVGTMKIIAEMIFER